MEKEDFVVVGGNEGDKGFFARNVRLLAIIAAIVVLIVGIVLISLRISDSKKLAEADKAYSAYAGYYELSSSSTKDEISSAMKSLIAGESQFKASSPEAVRINFYKADLYGRLEDLPNRILSLEKVARNASKANYLLPISLYDLAIAYEESGDTAKAAENYSKVYETYGSDSELSDRSLFALYRIFCQNEPEKANGYLKILENEFKDSEYTRFLMNLKSR